MSSTGEHLTRDDGPAKSRSIGDLSKAKRLLALDKLAGELGASLEAAAIPFILLKGPSTAALLYGGEDRRFYQDLDILVAPSRFEDTKDLLTSRGFYPGHRRPGEPGHASHAEVWVRDPFEVVDLHHTIVGPRASPAQVWQVLNRHTETLLLWGAQLPVLDPPTRAMHIALHAGQHGRAHERPMQDLLRAVASVPVEDWECAVATARELGALELFAAGLRTTEPGRQLAESLNLPSSAGRGVVLRAAGRDAEFALTLERLVRERGLPQKACYLWWHIFPPAHRMRAAFPWAKRGAVWLGAAYLWRPFARAKMVSRGVTAWWGAGRPTGATTANQEIRQLIALLDENHTQDAVEVAPASRTGTPSGGGIANQGHHLPRLLLVSHVTPGARGAGQSQRVYYTLRALQGSFSVTFLTFAPAFGVEKLRADLLELCDDAIVLPSLTQTGAVRRVAHKLGGEVYRLRTGLKASNRAIGEVELSPARVIEAINPPSFEVALFEYFHATASIAALQASGVPCVLDMHNIMWQSYAEQLRRRPLLPGWWVARQLPRYRQAEEDAWCRFDRVVAINTEEARYAGDRLGDSSRVWCVPMGLPLEEWPYCWGPASPPRLAYYGGLGQPDRERGVFRCYEDIMPKVWRAVPNAQLWVIGGRPTAQVQSLAADERVTVTGWLDDVRPTLGTMTALLCPWSGRFGFRSRLAEVMALGLPVVATPDAVYGMGLATGEGLFCSDDDDGIAQACIALIEEQSFALDQSRKARAEVEAKLGFDATYGQLTQLLLELIGTSSSVSRA